MDTTTETVPTQAPPGAAPSSPPQQREEAAEELRRFAVALEQWAQRHRVWARP